MVQGMKTGGEVWRFLGRLEDVLARFRYDKQSHICLLDDAVREAAGAESDAT